MNPQEMSSSLTRFISKLPQFLYVLMVSWQSTGNVCQQISRKADPPLAVLLIRPRYLYPSSCWAFWVF
jgi:hypothetical protein